MKGSEIVNAVIEATNYAIVVELPNGHLLTTSDYEWGTNKRGEPVLIIKAGRRVK